MTQTLSEMLDVQPDDVEVSVDDDGAVTYVVSTGSQDDVKDLQDQISSDMFTTILDTQVAETSDIKVETIVPDDTVTIAVQTPSGEVISQSEVDITTFTSSPTKHPIYQPTNKPTSRPVHTPTSRPTNKPTEEPNPLKFSTHGKMDVVVPPDSTTEEVAEVTSSLKIGEQFFL